ESAASTARPPAAAAASSAPQAVNALHAPAPGVVAAGAGRHYRLTLHGGEFFLRDHVVSGRRILPGVAYLEMVRAAVASSVHAGVTLRDVAWVQPFALEDGAAPATLELLLTPGADGELAFEVRSGGGDGPSRLHCQGMASLSAALAAPPALSVRAAPAEGGTIYAPGEIYAAFSAMGVHYGPAHRPLRALRVPDDGEIVATLQLPDVVDAGLAGYGLHPAMLDGALQAAIGWLLPHPGDTLPLPFHLRRLQVLGPCTAVMEARVRRSADEVAAPTTGDMAAAGSDHAGAAARLDLDLFDDAGRLCVRIEGLASRHAGGRALALSSEPHALVLAPVWEQVAVLPSSGAEQGIRPSAGERVWLLPCARGSGTALQACWPGALAGDADTGVDHVVWAAPDGDPVDPGSDAVLGAQEAGVYAVFRAIKALLDRGYGARPLAWTLITTAAAAVHDGERIDAAHAGVRGLAGTLAREYPAWSVRVLDLERGWTAAAEGLRAALALPAIDAVVRDGACYRQKLAPLHVLDRVAAPRLRESSYRAGGVYVVIGGAGGIGAIWTRYVMQACHAQVVWIGRRAPDAGIGAALDAVMAEVGYAGNRPLYLQADAADHAALAAARAQVLARFGRIDGLVHAAAVQHDRTLAHLDEAALRAAYTSKVDTSVRMAQVFAADRLDFVLYFSSLVAFARPPGQAGYVAGCVFQDGYAQALAGHWSCAVKVMNWGYWGGVGMATDAGYRARMAHLGVGSINAAEGMEALEMLLADTLNQSALVNVTRPLADLSHGVYAGVLASGGTGQPGDGTAEQIAPAAGRLAGPPDEAALTAIVAEVLSVALKVDIDDIDLDEPFTAYGVDSITGVQLAQTLNQRLGLALDVTLFFDHGTVRRLARHLRERHGDALAAAPATPAGADAVSDVADAGADGPR
ncbi:MAG: SDR family NAD(P)-dependent oxidoreductase, partial [Duganella sp.]